MSITDTKGTSTIGGCGCGTCSTCTGLRTFTRPRFFAGQLLTDTELTALSAYTIDKNRLHNRYLHGAGVVCGMAVECDGCGPGVVVQPGYALDQLGNDVVLPNAAAVDVLALIEACRQQDKVADCDPPRWPTAQGCEEDEKSYCLWVRYAEQTGRLVTPIGGPARPTCGCSTSRTTGSSSGCGCGASTTRTTTRPSTASSGGCGCGGSRATTTHTTVSRSGSGCGCGGSSGSATSSIAQPRASGTDCEPSRISELVDFGVAQIECSCDESLSDRLAGTFPVKVAECIKAIRPVLSNGLTKRMQTHALSAVTGGSLGASDGSAREAICTLYGNVADLYRRDPLRTQCVLPAELSSIDCSPQGPNETDAHYQQRLQAAALALLQLVLLYLRDCICAKVLPPCPDGCDDRVMLACVTVRDGSVVRICNLACRRYAGSFVSREYWMPIGPVLSWLAALVCCFPLPTRRLARVDDDVRVRRNARRVAEPVAAQARRAEANIADVGEEAEAGARFADAARTSLLQGQLDDVITAFAGDGFVLGSLWRRRAAATAARLHPQRLLDQVTGTLRQDRDTVGLAPLLHTDVAQAGSMLRKRGVQVRLVEVQDRSEALGLDLVPRAAKGETATLYTMGGVVVGVGGSRPTVSLRDLFAGDDGVARTAAEEATRSDQQAEPAAEQAAPAEREKKPTTTRAAKPATKPASQARKPRGTASGGTARTRRTRKGEDG